MAKLEEQMNMTSPGAHRQPHWMGWYLLRTCDPPMSLMDHLNDWLLYVQLKNPPPWNTATYVVEEK